MQEPKNNNFNHFKIHSQYSRCEGAIKIDELSDHCTSKKIKSIGLSDTSNLSGALEFSENISKVGTQPIIGTQIIFNFENAKLVFKTLLKLKEKNRLIIYATHNKYFANMADCKIELIKGKIRMIINARTKK